MAELQLTAQMKNLFLDRLAIQRQIDRNRRRPLMRAGGLVRTIARRSIRKVSAPKKGFSKTAAVAARQRARVHDASPAGTPPKSRSPEPNLRTIFFVWDHESKSVVVGPVVLNSRSTDRTAPDIHEHGGRAVIRRGRKRIRGTYKPRPVMGPAMEKALPKIADEAKNFIGPSYPLATSN